MEVLILLLLVAAVLSVAGASPMEYPKDWPDQFMINFSSNITTEGVGENPLSGIMYYDWTQQVQRVDHAPGAVECTEFYNTNGGCVLIFNPQGMYRILNDPIPEGSPECCLDMDSIHASPPDWAMKSNPTYNGEVVDPYSKLLSFKWTFDNLNNAPYLSHRRLQDKEPHMYFQTWKKKQPLVFTFPGKDGIQDYHFDVDSMKSAPKDLPDGAFDGIFDLPTGCNIACP
jgi:hypothetical protein